MPESFIDKKPQRDDFPGAVVRVESAEQDGFWEGFVYRTEGNVNELTRTQTAVVKIEDPYRSRSSVKAPLKIGQFVEVGIDGETLENVFVFPRSAVYRESEVILLENGLLNRKPVELLWSDERFAVVETGLEAGSFLVTTPLGSTPSGTQGKLADTAENPRREETANPFPFSE